MSWKQLFFSFDARYSPCLDGGHGGADLAAVVGDQHQEVPHRPLPAVLGDITHAVTRVILPDQSEIKFSLSMPVFFWLPCHFKTIYTLFNINKFVRT